MKYGDGPNDEESWAFEQFLVVCLDSSHWNARLIGGEIRSVIHQKTLQTFQHKIVMKCLQVPLAICEGEQECHKNRGGRFGRFHNMTDLEDIRDSLFRQILEILM